MSNIESLQRKIERERVARKRAEALLEQKSCELHEANEQLRDLADRTRAIVDTAPEGIVSYDDTGAIFSINRSAQKIFARDTGSTSDIRALFEPCENLDAILFPGEEATVVCELTIDNGVPTLGSCVGQNEPDELVGRRPSGTFPAEVAVSQSVHRGVVSYTASVRDLTRRKEIESRHQHAQKMESMGTLASGIAHEINTPIQFVSNNIQFLQGAFEDIGELLILFDSLVNAIEVKEPTGELLEKISEQSELADLAFLKDEFPSAIEQSINGIERVATIIRAMKEFSQPTSQKKYLYDINAAIENVFALTVNQYRDVATITTSLDAEIPKVLCHGEQFNQVFLNLIANAAEALAAHGEGDGRVEISSKRVSQGVQVVVRDNGPGIPNEIRSRIFDPFFTTKEVGKGMGQGLAFVYDVVVNKHSGGINVTCPPEGGTSFVITLLVEHSQETTRREHADSIS